MPKIGMAGVAVMLLPAMETIRIAADLGYDAVELSGEFPQCVCDDITEQERKQARALVEDTGIRLGVHAPFNSLNMAALNPGIRAESMRQILAAIDMCADMGGDLVTVHNGRYVVSGEFRKKVPEVARLQWDYNLEALRRAADRAEKRGVSLCLENIGFEAGTIDRCVDDLLAIRDAVASQALWFCVDIGHARLNNELDDVVSRLGPLARQIHFTDNSGKTDDHLIIGRGNFDYTSHLDFYRQFDGILLLEVIQVGTDPGPARESLQYMRALLNP
ncbi:MAG: sugar phosphate isomerase/epimerase family protein [Thermodesulfobacteriota bacterium]|nr:sugar phosphate isomerase/epimerase family protein [Thermodesulfobacteriota bacterium]